MIKRQRLFFKIRKLLADKKILSNNNFHYNKLEVILFLISQPWEIYMKTGKIKKMIQ